MGPASEGMNPLKRTFFSGSFKVNRVCVFMANQYDFVSLPFNLFWLVVLEF